MRSDTSSLSAGLDHPGDARPLAEEQAALGRVARQQAALRRLATLIAESVVADVFFQAVVEEMSGVFGSDGLLYRYDSDARSTLLAIHPPGESDVFVAGSRWPLDSPSLGATIFETGRAARIDDYSDLSGEVASAARGLGVHSAIGVPVVVEGELWGALCAVIREPDRTWAPDMEARLAEFTDLVGTAIANIESRERIRQLADEQAALRRVATFVAQEPSPAEIFQAVTEEASRVLDIEAVGLLRFEADGAATLVAQSDTPWDPPPPLGTRLTLDGENFVVEVFRTRRSVRVDDWAGSTGAVASMASVLGVRSSVASPVVVEGRLWGTIVAATSQSEPLPPEIDSRLAQFTDLVATAIANAQARDELSRLAEEQAALRSVAVLVAQQPSQDEVFAAVTEAIGPILGADLTAMQVFRDDGVATVVASWSEKGPALTAGTQLPLAGESVVGRIFRTAAAARLDTYADVEGETAEVARELRLRSTVGAPILVDGKLWGALMAATRGDEPFSEDAEARIAAFTELVATAVANTQAHEQLTTLADEQAALRRVATLVAKEASLPDVLAGVADEVAHVLGDVEWALTRDEGDGIAIVLAVSAGNPASGGDRVPIDTSTSFGRAIIEGRPARIDYTIAEETEVTRIARAHGIRAAVSWPIVVRGRTWGAMSVGWRHREANPAETETVLGRFSELIATAIANAEAREEVERLAAEQAALRRVATFVAQGVPPTELFSAVSTEVAHVFSGPEPSLLATVIRFDPGPECVLVGASRPYELEPVGSRWSPKELYVSTRVLNTGRSARIDEVDLDAIDGRDADLLRLRGFLHQVGSPVVVDGHLWGAMTLNSSRPFPPDVDERLEGFTELIATAIANAESRDALARLADEQAALGRVAGLVARGAASSEIFDAVCLEAGKLVGAEGVNLWEYTADGRGVVVASGWRIHGPDLPRGLEIPLATDTAIGQIRQTGRPARIDGYENSSSELASRIQSVGVRSSLGAPVIVDGELWGALAAGTGQDEPLPAGTEDRLARFTDLVATAISNADARNGLRTAAAEQAALRRVATLVARGVPQEEVFGAVAEEVGQLFDADLTVMGRYDGDSAVALGSWSSSHHAVIPEGTRSAIDGRNVLTQVAETGMPARLDDYDDATGEAGEIARRFGWRSSIAAPIVDEGRVWGVIIVASTRESFPPDSEHRLADFTELIATSIGNAEAHAQLIGSRARIVAAGDEARRRIERNLHDGTQQRLIALGLDLQTVRATVPPELHDTHEGFERMQHEIDGVLQDVRELSRGLHPSLLSRAGLGPAVRALARRSPIPVELEIDVGERPAEPLETTVYFVVSESLTNAIKHSQASAVWVSISSRDSAIVATVADNGVGGARLDGSGITGLVDRVEAIGGRFGLRSPAGEGTTVSIELPLAVAVPGDAPA